MLLFSLLRPSPLDSIDGVKRVLKKLKGGPMSKDNGQVNVSKDRIHDLIREAYSCGYNVYAWSVLEAGVTKTELRLTSYSIQNNELVLHAEGDSLLKIKGMITGLCRIDFYIAEEAFFFTSLVRGLDPQGNLYVSFPESCCLYERRKFERLDLDVPLNIGIKTKNRFWKRKCYDISKGGFSLAFAKGDGISPERIINETCNVTLESAIGEMEFIAKIVNVLKLRPHVNEKYPYASVRASFRFIELSPKQTKFLEDLVDRGIGLIKNLKKAF